MYDTIQKTIIAWAFNHYIAYYYFDNVNVNQLKVAFEKGEIELENLPVKSGALKHFKLPWNVVSGVVGKLSIRIPLMTPLTDSWLIKLDNLTLIVSPSKQSPLSESQLEMIQDSSHAYIRECLDNDSRIGEDDDDNDDGNDEDEDDEDGAGSINEKHRRNVNSEETKLAEFYSSFSATVSSMVKDIYRNIKLEINSMTLLFEDFNHGLVKFSADRLLLHRPYNVRNLVIENLAIYMSRLGPHTWNKRDDLLRINLNSCNLELCDVSYNGNHASLEINSETGIKGSLYFVSSMGTSSIPLCEFLLEDLRVLYFTGEHQQDGSVFAKISCYHFNREQSSYDNLLKPWPFNLSWDKRSDHRKYSLTSDEQAEFTMSSALLDLVDVVMRRILTDARLQSKLWPLTRSPVPTSQLVTQEFNSILVLHNETGHRLHYASVDENIDIFDASERSKSTSPTMAHGGGDNNNIMTPALIHELSLGSKSSADNERDCSGEDHRSIKWFAVNNGDTVPLETTRTILVRVEGWKTLLPIQLDKTGLFFREAYSDRVMNEDTYIVISIDLEDKSARKIISIRSPLNLVNHLDATLEVHFNESNQSFYIKPGGQLGVPLPYLFDRMHIRPCNVGVTMSEQPIIWDEIKELSSFDKVYICHPVTITNKRHASYSTSQDYQICGSMRRETGSQRNEDDQTQLCTPIPVFSITFMPPLTIVDLLPKKIYESSPQDSKLFHYNYNTNLAQHIGGRSTRQLFTSFTRGGISELSFVAPGIKLILVDNLRERIAEVSIEDIVVKSTTKAREQVIDCSLQDIRIENALPDCEKSIVLDRTSALNDSLTSSPAIRLIMDRILGKSFGTVWFRQVQLSMCELALNIEEKLFLKLVEFISFRDRGMPNHLSRLARHRDGKLNPEGIRLSKYYFDLLRIDLSSLKLSVFTSTNLPLSLQRLKTRLGLKFFGFEDAQVQLSPYFKMNFSTTMRGIFDSISRFYKRQFSEQTPRIVGQQIQNYLRFHLSDLLSALYDEVYNKLLLLFY